MEAWKIIFLSKWVICMFQPLIFQGVYKTTDCPPFIKDLNQFLGFYWIPVGWDHVGRIHEDFQTSWCRVWDLLRKTWLPLTASPLNSKTWKQMHRDAPDASEFFLKMDHFPNEIELNTKSHLWNQHLVSLICGFHQPHIHISLHIVQPPHRIAHSIPQLHGRIWCGFTSDELSMAIATRMYWQKSWPLTNPPKLGVVPSTFTTVYS